MVRFSKLRFTGTKLMASARKKSNSKSPRTVKAKQFAVCVRNDDYPASLELLKLYRVLEDRFASQHDLVRVVDESGEDYLYPSEYFVRVALPAALEQKLRKIA